MLIEFAVGSGVLIAAFAGIFQFGYQFYRYNTLDEPALIARQEAVLRKLLTELNGFNNVYYELCDVPYCSVASTAKQAMGPSGVRDEGWIIRLSADGWGAPSAGARLCSE